MMKKKNPITMTANLNPASRIAGANLNTRYAIAQKPISSSIIFFLF